MKVLFSSDWHLGYELGGANRVDRFEDQLRQLRKIADYLEVHNVGVLAIAGDIFEAQDRGRARLVVRGLLDALSTPLARGLQIVGIAGNHDRDYFIDTANLWLGVHRPSDGSRIVLRTRPELVPITAGSETLNFVLLPFPTPTRYDLDSTAVDGAGQRNEQLAKRFIEEMERLRKQAEADRHPTILLAHVTVQGTEVGPHRITPREDVVIPQGAFPSFEMTVVGHIHKADKRGSEHFYYVGGLDRMDIGERLYQPRVLMADIGRDGVLSVESLPLDPTPFVEVVASSEDELRARHAQLPRPEETLVRLRLQAQFGTYTAPLIDLARQLFPRLYSNVEHEWTGAPEVRPPVEGIDPADVQGTIRRYLAQQGLDKEEHDLLIALLSELSDTGAGA